MMLIGKGRFSLQDFDSKFLCLSDSIASKVITNDRSIMDLELANETKPSWRHNLREETTKETNT